MKDDFSSIPAMNVAELSAPQARMANVRPPQLPGSSDVIGKPHSINNAPSAPAGVTFSDISPEDLPVINKRFYSAGDLKGVTLTDVDAPHNTVFDEKNKRTIALPQTLNADETHYIIQRDADDIKTFFAMQDVGGFQALGRGFGAGPIGVGLPQVVGAGLKEAAETQGERAVTLGDAIGIGSPSAVVKSLFKTAKDLAVYAYGKDDLVKAGDGLVERNRKYMADHGWNDDNLTPLNKALYTVGNVGNSVLASIGLTYATRNPGTAAVVFGAIQKTQTYQEARDALKSPEDASAISNVDGSINAALELFGGHGWLEGLKGNTAVKRFVKGFVAEGATEGAQQASNEAITQTTGIRQKSLQDTAQDILLNFAVGGLAGGVTGAALGRGVRDEAKRAGLDDATAAQLGKYAVENIEDARQNANEFIDKELSPIADNPKSVAEFMTLMQKFGTGDDLVQRESLSPEDRDLFDQYVEHFKTQPRDDAGVADTEKSFYDQAITAGVDQEQAFAASKLIGARADAASRALGITPAEWLASKNLSVSVEGSVVEPDAPFMVEAKAIKEDLLSPQNFRTLTREDPRSVGRFLGLQSPPLSVLQFIRKQGGISLGLTHQELGNLKDYNKERGLSTSKAALASGELRRIFDGKKNLGHYVSEKGMGLDDLYRALVDHGYIEKTEGAQDQSDPQAVLDLIEKEANGQKVYSAEIEHQLNDIEDATSSNSEYLDSLGIDRDTPLEEIARILSQRDQMFNQNVSDNQDQELPDEMFFQDDAAYKKDGDLKTSSKAFKEWFAASKVVDADGNPLVVYHGTDAEFDAFNADAPSATGVKSRVFFFTDSKGVASGYGDKTLPSYLSVQEPVTMDFGGKSRVFFDGADRSPSEIASRIAEINSDLANGYFDTESDLRHELEQAGWDYLSSDRIDGIIAKNVNDTMEMLGGDTADHYIAFSPTQIKSVHNRGTFDPNDANILNQDNGKVRGSIEFSPDKTAINLFKDANASTLLHEMGHLFLRDMRDVAAKTIRPNVKADYEIVKKWLGATGSTLTVRQEEKFARGFEQYLREGKAPVEGLQGVFDRFKQWLTSVYKSAKELNVELSPDVRKVFDRMLGGDYAMAERLNQEAAARDVNADIEIVRNTPPERTLLRDTGAIFQSAGRFAADTFVPMSTRVGKINERLQHVVGRYVFNTTLVAYQRGEIVRGFVTKAQKLSAEDFRELDFALKNGLVDQADAIFDKNGMQEDFQKVRDLLDEMNIKANEAGMDMGYLENYFPRSVRKGMAGEYIADMKRQKEWSDIQLAINKADPNGAWDDQTKTIFINTYLRNYAGSGVTASSSHSKERTVKYIRPEFNKYYEDSMDSLLNYISGVTKAIEVRTLFGISDKSNINQEKLDESVGNYVGGLVSEGTINHDQEEVLKSILKGIINPSGPGAFISWLRDSSYIYTMGNPISALTQVEDLASSLHENGYFNTAVSLGRALTGKQIVTREELGLEDIRNEFSDKSRSANAVRNVFKAVGLSWTDGLGKETFLDAKYRSLVAQSKKDKKAFSDRLDTVFGDEADSVREDFKNGTISDNVKYLLTAELAGYQPISIYEMPLNYARSGNGRIVYQLKTFTIKRFDLYRRQIFDNITSGDPKKTAIGVKNLASFAFAAVLMGMTTDEIKNLILGREVEPSDLFMNNILKLFGVSNYQIYKAQRDGFFETAALYWAPPQLGVGDEILRDVTDNKPAKDARVLSHIPLLGPFYFWYFGGGDAKKTTGLGARPVSGP